MRETSFRASFPNCSRLGKDLQLVGNMLRYFKRCVHLLAILYIFAIRFIAEYLIGIRALGGLWMRNDTRNPVDVLSCALSARDQTRAKEISHAATPQRDFIFNVNAKVCKPSDLPARARHSRTLECALRMPVAMQFAGSPVYP